MTVGAYEHFLEAYTKDGTFFWRMAMGPNRVYQYSIEPGSSAISIGHGDNVTVYDMDGDGLAEVLIRTSNGVVLETERSFPAERVTTCSFSRWSTV